MKAFMTNGTFEYLSKLEEQHPFILMHNADTAIAYYEDDKNSSIFKTSRNYEVVLSQNDLQETGFIALTHLPITDEGAPIFELEFKETAKNITDHPGFIALRLLRPSKGKTYILLTEWRNKYAYQRWKNDEGMAIEQKPYSAGPAYTNVYQVGEEEA
ncbi:antibiotic biosynthesis monooxygenase family protein [Gracilibacillus dipsosauri]|uniref:antibiotic biosynthesis monooxygenase family protein n=1 Tax=Gracilibacillus dipsosauri TaxID=178340 RepID=UPI002409C589